MARKEKLTISQSLRKMMLWDEETNDSPLIYKVIGFMPATDFTDNAMLISNLAYVLSMCNLNTCVADFKVFSPNLYQYLDVVKNEKGRGLLNILKSDKVDLREEINQTKYDNLYLLSPSPHDLLEEYFDFDFPDIERVIETLKDMFDMILIDIPNIPALEFCVGAIKNCHMGFFTASERVEAAKNMAKIMEFSSSLGISPAKFGNVIFMNLQGLTYDFNICKEYGLNIVAYFPLIKRAVANSLEGKLYLKDEALVDKHFSEQLESLAKQVLMQK